MSTVSLVFRRLGVILYSFNDSKLAIATVTIITMSFVVYSEGFLFSAFYLTLNYLNIYSLSGMLFFYQGNQFLCWLDGL